MRNFKVRAVFSLIVISAILLTAGSITQVSAPTNATYVLNTANAKLANAQVLGSLGTGIMKVTTGTGIISDAASSDVVGLFSGCSGVLYLGADGACHTVGSAQTFPAAGIMVSTGSAFGTSLADPLTGTHGGTGVNNGASTITLGGSLTTSGAFATTITVTNTTNSTLPAGTHKQAGLYVVQTFSAAQTFSAIPVLVNTTTDLGAAMTVADTRSTSPRGILSLQNSTDTNGARIGFAKSRGTAASPTIVVTGDTLGRSIYRGYDGATYLEMAAIEAVATGTIAATRVPTYMAFSTATDATPSVLTERMRIDSAGNLAIGKTSAGALLDVAGTVQWGPAAQGQLLTSGNDAYLQANLSNANMIFRTNSGGLGERVRISASGGVSIGNTTDPGAGNLSVTGTLAVTGNATVARIIAGTTNQYQWFTRSIMTSPGDGVMRFTNNAETDFDRLQFGGTTSSFPALKRSSTTLAVRLADDSADAPISASNLTTSGAIIDSSAAPSISGCTATIGTGAKGTTGFYTSGTTGVCTVTLTFAYTAATGWVCATSDETTGNLSRQTAYTTTTATVQGTTVTGDSVTYSCRAF